MRTDLGTWRGPQADAVVRALERAGLSPRTEDARDGTRITVPAGQHDAAHRVLAGAMDDIAHAADRGPNGSKATHRPARGRRAGRDDDGGEPALVTERLRNVAPLVGLVTALLVAAMIPGGAMRTTVFVFALVAFGIVWARRNSDDDR
ncbi:MAG TPA: hypothetical protein VGA36_10040 [Nitriliruptorales bacterium]